MSRQLRGRFWYKSRCLPRGAITCREASRRSRQTLPHMTLIAAIRANSVHFLVGDILLSGPQTQGQSVSLPAMGDVTGFFGDIGWGVSGLRQKIALISDNCAVAWSGSMLGARVALTELRELAKTDVLTHVSAREFLESHLDADSLGTSFVGLVLDPGCSTMFGVRADKVSSGGDGAAFVSGSGAPYVHSFASFLGMPDNVNGATRLDIAHTQVQRFLAYLLRLELHAADEAAPIRSFFGGGYETAFPRRNKIVKGPDFTTIFWAARTIGDKVDLEVDFVVKQHYEGEYLVLRTFFPIAGGGKEEIQVVEPIWGAGALPGQDQLLSIELGSDYIQNFVTVRDGPYKDLLISTYRQLPGAEHVLITQGPGRKITFAPSLQFLQDTFRAIQGRRTSTPHER